MSLRRRLLAPVCLVAAVLAGCGPAAPARSQNSVGSQSTPAAAFATPASDSELLPGYIAAICPVFDALVIVDPRLTDLRVAAAEGGDMVDEQGSIASLSDQILVLLNELEALPAWEPGAALRFHLMDALHGIRARLLDVDREPRAPDAAAAIADMPFIATEALDRAMSVASQGGLVCDSGL